MEQSGWFKLENNGQAKAPAPKAQSAEVRKEPAPKTIMEEKYYPMQGKGLATKIPQPAAPLPSIVQSRGRESQTDPYGDAPQELHSQTVGPTGPVLLQDTVLHETLEQFVHSRPRDRVVHTKGYGATGYFRPYRSMAEYTKLCFLQNPEEKTPVATRFSLAVSNKGTPDTSRNVRGFSTKFYTSCGVFDLLCNHIPVFLVRDAIRFPEAIRALSASPVNGLIDPNRFWEFVARTPESTHFITWLYSDMGTVKSLRHIRGSSVNTYVWCNEAGERRFVKYHWIPMAGEEFINQEEAMKLAGENPDIAGQDLYDAIAKGQPVEYELRVQLLLPEEAESLSFDPLDDTKIWPEDKIPLVPVGRLTLDRNPENFLHQVEELAFAPTNLLEGAELSADKMLQGRSFIYKDAQRFRLGPDFGEIPVNRSRGTGRPQPTLSSGKGIRLSGDIVREEIPRADDFTQAGERYRSLTPEGREHLVENIAAQLVSVQERIRDMVLGYFSKADSDFAKAVAKEMEERGKRQN